MAEEQPALLQWQVLSVRWEEIFLPFLLILPELQFTGEMSLRLPLLFSTSVPLPITRGTRWMITNPISTSAMWELFLVTMMIIRKRTGKELFLVSDTTASIISTAGLRWKEKTITVLSWIFILR